jgi:exopolysaccharide biosynthesis predicted pyruvyltransferase EpsI
LLLKHKNKITTPKYLLNFKKEKPKKQRIVMNRQKPSHKNFGDEF